MDSEGRFAVGGPAHRQLVAHPERTIASPKRLLGCTATELSKHPALQSRVEAGPGAARIRIGERKCATPEIAAIILRELKTWAEMALGRPLGMAAIAVPANFNQAQRLATRDAARLAGFSKVWLPSEPAAAALAYGTLQKRRGTIAVCDFGGGTFDVSLIKLAADAQGRPLCEVLATAGDPRLGGDDMDEALTEMACAEIRRDFGIDLSQRRDALHELRKTLARAKHELSAAHQTQVHYPLGKAGLYVRVISRTDLEAVIAPLVERAARCAATALAGAGVEAPALDELILLGGCTRIPLVRRVLAQAFEREPRAIVETGQSVALGGALWAASLDKSGSQRTLRDVAPFAISATSASGPAEEIIPRNVPLPAAARRSFALRRGSSRCELALRECPPGTPLSAVAPLARIRLSVAKSRAAGAPARTASIEAHFLMDENGILHVLAPGRNAEEWRAVEVRPSAALRAPRSKK